MTTASISHNQTTNTPLQRRKLHETQLLLITHKGRETVKARETRKTGTRKTKTKKTGKTRQRGIGRDRDERLGSGARLSNPSE
jgi:hypothetical protein